MSIYNEIAEEFGLYTFPRNIPEHKYVFLAYKNGEVKEFETENEALSFSKLYQKSLTNRAEFIKFQDDLDELKEKVYLIWKERLFSRYPMFTEEQLNFVYKTLKAKVGTQYDVNRFEAVFIELLNHLVTFNQLGSKGV